MTLRRLTLASALASCAVLAACGQDTASTTTTTATTAVVSSATTAPASNVTTAPAATTEPATSTTSSAASETTSASSSASATRSTAKAKAAAMPTDPGAYGDAAVEAWRARDVAALKRYVSPKAVSGLSGAAPTGELLRTACEAEMCSYSTETGQRVTLTFDLAAVKAGRPGAITAVTVD